MKGLSLEVRVGLLVLIALALLAGFVFVLGGFSFGEGYRIYVDFDNPGNVKPGAPVNIGGIKVGSVEEIEYRGGRLDPETNTRALVRMHLSIDESVQDTIHDDAAFFVTAQSVLGEQVIAIDPGTYERPVLPEGSVVRGIDPPRLDLALAKGYELLEILVDALHENRDDLGELLSDLAGILSALNTILNENEEDLEVIIDNVVVASEEGAELMRVARGTIDSPEVQRIVRNLDRTLRSVARDVDPILTETRTAVASVNEVLGPEQRGEVQSAIHDAAELAERANATLRDAQAIVDHVQQGRGTIGALLMDEEIYDDLQEMLRDLKHNPWKFFWRE